MLFVEHWHPLFPVLCHSQAKAMSLEKKGLGGKPRTSAPFTELGQPMSDFKGYNLKDLQVPVECRPRDKGLYQGRHGYTVVAENGAETKL